MFCFHYIFDRELHSSQRPCRDIGIFGLRASQKMTKKTSINAHHNKLNINNIVVSYNSSYAAVRRRREIIIYYASVRVYACIICVRLCLGAACVYVRTFETLEF